jgi:hypothetical protein
LGDFHDSIFKGETAKGLIKVLLQKAGYSIYPYGYEGTLADIREKLQSKDTKNSPTIRRIRSSPDLLVYDSDRKDLMLVEIKMRTSETPYVEQRKMDTYREFWNDSILVLVVPIGNIFYAQRICDLERKEKYTPNSDFLRIEEVFPRIKQEDVKHYSLDAMKLMNRAPNQPISPP